MSTQICERKKVVSCVPSVLCIQIGILNDRFWPLMIFTYFDIWHQAQCIVMCVVQCPRSWVAWYEREGQSPSHPHKTESFDTFSLKKHLQKYSQYWMISPILTKNWSKFSGIKNRILLMGGVVHASVYPDAGSREGQPPPRQMMPRWVPARPPQRTRCRKWCLAVSQSPASCLHPQLELRGHSGNYVSLWSPIVCLWSRSPQKVT